MPAFASSLGLLEPTRSDATETSASSMSDTIAASSSLPPHHAGAALPDNGNTIPPAAFDWTSSGLTNILDNAPRPAFDLDFFDGQRFNASARTFSK